MPRAPFLERGWLLCICACAGLPTCGNVGGLQQCTELICEVRCLCVVKSLVSPRAFAARTGGNLHAVGCEGVSCGDMCCSQQCCSAIALCAR